MKDRLREMFLEVVRPHAKAVTGNLNEGGQVGAVCAQQRRDTNEAVASDCVHFRRPAVGHLNDCGREASGREIDVGRRLSPTVEGHITRHGKSLKVWFQALEQQGWQRQKQPVSVYHLEPVLKK